MRKSKTIDVKWGEIYYCDLGSGIGSVQSKNDLYWLSKIMSAIKMAQPLWLRPFLVS